MHLFDEWGHWLLVFLVFGGFFMLFASRPIQTRELLNTGVDTFGGIAGVMKNYVSGVTPQ